MKDVDVSKPLGECTSTGCLFTCSALFVYLFSSLLNARYRSRIRLVEFLVVYFRRLVAKSTLTRLRLGQQSTAGLLVSVSYLDLTASARQATMHDRTNDIAPTTEVSRDSIDRSLSILDPHIPDVKESTGASV